MGSRGRRISEFEVTLVYRVSSRTGRATKRIIIIIIIINLNNKKEITKYPENKIQLVFAGGKLKI